MRFTKLKTLAGSCVYFLFLAFSVSVDAAGIDQTDSGISIEAWSVESGQDLPILIFDENHAFDELYNDIRVENIIEDKDGSTRFQLSHSGPMSRQVFANVRRVEQDNGLTRSIITNIADGHQTEYLTRTTGKFSVKNFGKTDDGNMLAQFIGEDDQNIQCPWCYVLGFLASEAMCAATTSLAHYNCRATCGALGGVKYFDSGICGTAYSECLCWIAPRRIYEEF